MLKRGDRRGYEFSFGWLFALFVGAAVLALAVFIAIQLLDTGQYQRESEEAKRIGVLLTPAETGLEEGKFSTIYVDDETRLMNDCELPTTNYPFGTQLISLATRPSYRSEWQEISGIESSFHNKYIFSTKMPEAEGEFYVLSKPLSMPFRVSSLVILWSDKENYCLRETGADPQILTQLRRLNMTNIYLKADGCPSDSTEICFSGGCDIAVQFIGTSHGVVKKDAQQLPFILSTDSDPYALMYAAIFSDPDDYSCQFRRLAARAEYLSIIYSSKAQSFSSCGADIVPIFQDYASFLNTFKSGAPTQQQMNDLYQKMMGVKQANDARSSCPVY